jgi:hypothetical protein
MPHHFSGFDGKLSGFLALAVVHRRISLCFRTQG